MVIFGASGDLARRKLLPALYSLTRDRLLPARFAVLGFGRHAQDDDTFREEMRRGCDEFARRRPVDAALWTAFARNLFYQQGAYDDPTAFQRLKARLEEIERALGLPGNRVFYLSTPPSAFAPVIRSLGQADLAPQPAPGKPFARVIIEKPFGVDLETARALNRQASKGAAGTTSRPAACGTWSRTTSCRSSAWRRWSRRSRSRPTRFATRSSRC
jgi:glucose-6-phosphate 1-dehydrogenase